MSKPLLEVRNLRIEFATRYGSLLAVDEVSFDLREGEILGLVGESGAGKSITGLAVIGLLESTASITGGEIVFDGNRIDNLSPDEMRKIRGKHISAIFQDPLTSLNPLHTVGRQLVDTIRTHLSLTVEEARDRAVELLTEVGIPGADRRIDQYPHQFSGGMRQRVVIALALCAEPRIIIADEPTTALDVSIQAQILAILRDLCERRDAAIILVSHDMGVIAETADRVAVMYAGRLVEVGPFQEVIRTPKHPYTAGLMGSIPEIGSRTDRLIQIEGSMPRLSEIPSGCAFHPRCKHRMDRCMEEKPLLEHRGTSSVACFLATSPSQAS